MYFLRERQPVHTAQDIAQGEERLSYANMQLIEICDKENSPGRKLHIFEFRGKLWSLIEKPDGTVERSKSDHKKAIFIAAKNMYEAYVFLYTHIPGLVPATISYRGDIWVLPEKLRNEATSPQNG